MNFALTVPATLRAPYEARSWVGQLGIPLSEERADAVRLLVTELVTASVKHARLHQEREIEVSLQAEEGVVHVEVTDPAASRPDVREEPDDATGWGFYLVDKLSDRWGLSDGEPVRWWFELDVYRLPAPAPAVEEASAKG